MHYQKTAELEQFNEIREVKCGMKAKMNKTYFTAVINTSIDILNSHYAHSGLAQ